MNDISKDKDYQEFFAGIKGKPSASPVLQGPPKLLERFSKSYRNLQDSWNKSRILGGF